MDIIPKFITALEIMIKAGIESFKECENGYIITSKDNKTYVVTFDEVETYLFINK